MLKWHPLAALALALCLLLGSPAAPAEAQAWACPECGAENVDAFCTNCGARRPVGAWTCPECGAENADLFCTNCGAKRHCADMPVPQVAKKEIEIPPELEAQYGQGLRAYERKDYKTALESLLPAAEQGHPGAQVAMGMMYDYGYAVERNGEKAFEYYMMAADQGDAEGLYRVGGAYETGTGVDPSNEKARAYYWRAAELGNTSALLRLGNHFLRGLGVKLSAERAFEFYQQAVDLGDSTGYTRMAIAYEKGQGGLDEDLEAAIHYYKKALEMNPDDKQAQLFYDMLLGLAIGPAETEAPRSLTDRLRDEQASGGGGGASPVDEYSPYRPETSCTRCHGDKEITCTQCLGSTGKWVYTNSAIGGKSGQAWEDCSKCKGSGKIPCTRCGGSGKEP